MAVIVSGDIDAQLALSMVRKHFSQIPAGTKTQDIPDMSVSSNEVPVYNINSDKETGKELLRVFYLNDVRQSNTTAEWKEDLSDLLIWGMFSKRFQQLNQDIKSPFLYTQAVTGPLVRTKEALTLTGEAKTGRIRDAIKILFTEIERIKKYGFMPAEFAMEKQILIRQLESRISETEESKDIANQLVGNFLDGETPYDKKEMLEEGMRIIKSLRPEDLNPEIDYWLGREPIVVASIPEDQRKNIRVEMIASVHKETSGNDPGPWTNNLSGNSIDPHVEKAGKIVHEKELKEYGIKEWKLSNGATVILKPIAFENGKVLFTSISNGGTNKYPDDKYISALLATRVAYMGDLGNIPFSELSSLKKLNGINLAPWMNAYATGTRGSADFSSIEMLLKLNYLFFTELKADSASAATYLARFSSQDNCCRKTTRKQIQ